MENLISATRTRASHCLLDLMHQAHIGCNYRLIRIDSKHAPSARLTCIREHIMVPQLVLPFPGLQQDDVLLEVNGQLMLGLEQQQIDAALLHAAADNSGGCMSFVLLRQDEKPAQKQQQPQQLNKEQELNARLKRGEECLKRLESANTRLLNTMQHKEQQSEEPQVHLWEEISNQLSAALELNPRQQLKEAIEGEANAIAQVSHMYHRLESLQLLLEEKNAQLIALEREKLDIKSALHECNFQKRCQCNQTSSELLKNTSTEKPPQPAPRKRRTLATPTTIAPSVEKTLAPPSTTTLNFAALHDDEEVRDFDLLQRAAQLKVCQNKNYRSESESDYEN